MGKHCRKCGMAIRKVRMASEHPNWKGGRKLNWAGYWLVYVPKDSIYSPMGRKKDKKAINCYVLEHRLVVAQSLGRCLEAWEIVHHKNHDKTDNRLENLELLPTNSDNVAFNGVKAELEALRKRVITLEQKNRLLKYRLGEVKLD